MDRKCSPFHFATNPLNNPLLKETLCNPIIHENEGFVYVFLAGKKECDKVDKLMFIGFSEKEIAEFSGMMSRIAENLSDDGLTEEKAKNFFENQQKRR